jgi:uncharacterized tellurite resistance protein B-like protein
MRAKAGMVRAKAGYLSQPWQVLVDCPHCRTESAVVEWMDPAHGACAFGVPAERRCRMCGWQQVAVALPQGDGRCPGCHVELTVEEGRCARCGFEPALLPSVPPANLQDAQRARAALARWAEEEGEEDLDVFCSGSFGAPPDEVVGKLVRHEPVPTTFDVMAFLFPSSSSGGPVQRVVEGSGRVTIEEEAAQERAPSGAAPEWEARTAARLLASVMVADGKLLASERRLLGVLLEAERLPPLSSADLRLWRPGELPAPADAGLRDRLLEAAVQLMHVDGERDESEWRFIRAVARRWGVAERKLAGWDRRYEARYSALLTRGLRWGRRWLRGRDQ